MSKKDISKILTKGTAKQRLILIAEDVARGRYSKDKILTDHEYNTISDSFKTPAEIKLWNKWKRIDEKVANCIMNLQGLKGEVVTSLSDLRGYILVLHTIENAEVLVNSVLHEVKDPIERKRISEKGAKGVNFLFNQTTIDPEGYVDIKIDFEGDSYTDENGKLIADITKPRKTKEHTLLTVANNVRETVIKTATQYLSWSKAIEDFMDEEGFNVKTYKEIIRAIDSQVLQSVIGWAKYLETHNNFITGLPHLRADKIKAKAKYNIAPNLYNIKVDEDIYNYFTKEFLKDE
jgi:hypothetical protein